MINRIRKILMFFAAICLLPITIIIILIRPFILIRFGNLEYKRIGHLSLDTAIYITKKKKSEHTIDFIGYSKKKVSNIELLNLWKKKLKIYNLSFFFEIFIFSLNFFIKNKEHEIKLYSLEKYTYLIQNKNFINIELRKEASKFFNHFKIPILAKWVCIHNRDNAYMSKNFKFISNNQISIQNHRNFDIRDFNSACKKLISLGYYVIRVGSLQEKHINLSSDKIIDYSNSTFRSDYMDLFLLSKCRFYLGSDSGIGNISVISDKYKGLCNATDFYNLQIQNFKRVIIFKKYYSNKLQKFLSLKEIFDNNIHKFSNILQFEAENITVINNNEKEIEGLAEDLDKILNNNYTLNKEDEKNHIKFWNIVKKYGLNPKNNYNEIRVSNYFLKNNLYLINL